MDDPPVEFSRSEFVVSTDRGLIDPDRALALLRTTFWAATMDRAVLIRAMANSICFGLLEGENLIGFGRVVTDLSTYAYWTDVVIEMNIADAAWAAGSPTACCAHPGLQGLRRVALLTRDAAALYAGVGFHRGTRTAHLHGAPAAVITRWLAASFHLLALGIGLGAVWCRGRALRGPLDQPGLRRVFMADGAWGIAALLWLGTGLWRLLAGMEKTPATPAEPHLPRQDGLVSPGGCPGDLADDDPHPLAPRRGAGRAA